MARGRPKKGESYFNPFEQNAETYDRLLEPEDQELVEREIASEVRSEMIFDEPEEEMIYDIFPQVSEEWSLIDEAPKDGARIIVTNGIDEIKAYCRMTRTLFKFRWVPRAAWFDALTNMKLSFTPTHWKHV